MPAAWPCWRPWASPCGCPKPWHLPPRCQRRRPRVQHSSLRPTPQRRGLLWRALRPACRSRSRSRRNRNLHQRARARPGQCRPRVGPQPPPPPTVTPATPVAAVAPAQAAEVWQLAPAVHLYPDASGPASGGPWLILLESTHPATPLAGAVGDLLDKMLRALGLHQHPQVWLAVLQRPGGLPMAAEMAGSLAPVDWQPLPAQLAHTLQTVQPARVLLLGQKVAQTVLERHEPVGQLRQQRFDLAGHAAAVSYDPSFLLRTSQPKKYKAQTWADLQFAAQLPSQAE